MAEGVFKTKNAKPSLGFTFSKEGKAILKRDVEVSSKGNISMVDEAGQNGATANNVRPEGFN